MPDIVMECIRAPERGRGKLPALIRVLADANGSRRYRAAAAISLVAVQFPERIPTVIERVQKIVDADEANLEAVMVLGYLSAKAPTVEPKPQSRPRSPYLRNAYLDEDTSGSVVTKQSSARVDTDQQEPSTLERIWSGIEYASRFESLERHGDVTENPFALTYPAVATLDDQRRPVAVDLFRVPQSADRVSFVSSLMERVERWRRVSDHDGVLRVYEVARDPVPWATTAYQGTGTLATRGPLSFVTAVSVAKQLTSAVAHLHDHGVVHESIGPHAVRFFDDHFTGDTSVALTGAGLLSLFRGHGDPTTYLDPRFAAPEYFDATFGSTDTRTDVYQLGAVLYTVFTGRPPFGGDSTTAVRRAVLEDPFPTPSDHSPGVPAAVDRVIATATAKEKLARYESVTPILNALRRVETP